MLALGKKIAVVLSLGLATIVLANFAINNPYTHRLVKAALHEKLKGHSPLRFEYEDLSLSLLPLRATLYGLRVEIPSHYPSPPLLQTSFLQVSLSWWDVLIGNKVIKQLMAQDMDLYWPPPWDFPGFGQEETGPLTWPPRFSPFIEEVVVANGRINATFLQATELPRLPQDLFLSLKGLNLRWRLDGWRRMDLALSAESSHLYLGHDHLLDDTRLSTELSLQDKELTAAFISLNSQQIDMKGTAKGKLVLDPKTQGCLGLDILSPWQGQANLSLLGSYLGIPKTYGEVEGKLSLSTFIPLAAEASQSHFSIQGLGQAQDAYIGGYRLFDSRTSFVIDDKGILFQEAELIADGRIFGKAKGHIGFHEDLPFAFTATSEKLSFKLLLDALGIPFEAFDFNIQANSLSLEGQGFPFHIELASKARIEAWDVPLLAPYRSDALPPRCEMELALNITEKHLHFDHAQGHCQPAENFASSPVSLGGDIFFSEEQGLDLTVTSPDWAMELFQAYSPRPLSGRAALETRVFGPYTDIKVQNRVQGHSLNIAGVAFGAVSGQIDIIDKKIYWQGLSSRPKLGGRIFMPQGGYEPQSQQLLETHIEAEKLSRAFMQSLTQALFPHAPWAFALESLRGHWQGPLFMPADARGQLTFALAKVKWHEEALGDTLRGKLNALGHSWLLESAFLNFGHWQVGAELSITKAKRLRLQTQASDPYYGEALGFAREDQVQLSIKTMAGSEARVDDWHRFPIVGKRLQAAKFKGVLTAEGHFQGDMRGLQGSFHGRCERLSLWDTAMAPLYWQGFVDAGRMQFTFDQGGGSLEGRFAFDLSREGLPFEWYLQFRRFDMRAFASPYFSSDARNYAYFSGLWLLKGELSRWWQANGELGVSHVRLKYVHDMEGRAQSVVMENQEAVKVLFTPKGWFYEQSKPLVLQGDLLKAKLLIHPSRPPASLHMVIDCELKAQLMAQLSKHVENATGALGLQAELQGAVDDLKFSAHVFDIPTDGPLALGLADLRPELRGIEVDATYQKGLVTINHFRAHKGLGRISMAGKLSLDDSTAAASNVNVSFEQIKVIYPVPYLKSFETLLSGEVQISGLKKPYLVAGDIRIDKARSTRKVDLQEEVVGALRQESLVNMGQSGVDNPWLQFNLNIFADKSIHIYNKNLQLVMSSELQLQGHEHKQVLLGHMKIDKGKFTFKRSFDIRRGELTFDDPMRIDPKLDIIGSTEVSAYKVAVAVSGTASKPVVDLLVDPSTREDGSAISSLDTLVLLSRGSLPAVEGASAEAQGMGISEVVNNIVWSQGQLPFEKISQTFGQDLVQVYPDMTTDTNGSPVLQLNGILKLTENIEAIYKKTQGQSQFSVKVPVHNNISLSGSMVQNQDENTVAKEGKENTSVDLKFRFSIK